MKLFQINSKVGSKMPVYLSMSHLQVSVEDIILSCFDIINFPTMWPVYFKFNNFREKL